MAMQKAVEEAQAEVLPAGAEVAQLPPSANKILSEGVQVTKATVSVSGEIEVSPPWEMALWHQDYEWYNWKGSLEGKDM